VEAEFAVTNTLGIRDNIYRGPITLEEMFNVFPFENTLTVMFLSGREVQELADYITDRSSSRGCQAQAQVAGISFVMNCGRVIKEKTTGEIVPLAGEGVLVNGQPLNPGATYKIATNDYMAKGGSGFEVLQRNTSKLDTGVSLRDALIDHMATLPVCERYELDQGFCDRQDELSLSMCRQIGGRGRIPGQAEAGPYANLPCVLGLEDGRIGRKTSDVTDTPPAGDPHADPDHDELAHEDL
jgi:hypothetical protein